MAGRAVRAIDFFVDELDLGELGFGGVQPHATGRPAYPDQGVRRIGNYVIFPDAQSESASKCN